MSVMFSINMYISGSIQATYVIETMMEHVAKALGKDPLEVKRLNLYRQGDVR